MMPQRRPMFGMSDGESTGAQSPMATPFTGTGTDGDADDMSGQYDADAGGMGLQESPAALRRRIMPIAGTPAPQTDALSVMRQALAPPNAPKMGGY